MTNDLQQTFLLYAGQHCFWLPGHKVLAAVSGGVDSMVMLHLLHAVGVDCAVAHCNFSLRGEESDSDEFFVRKEVGRLGLPLHVTLFDTAKYAETKRLSIQMAARELRYQWFEELSEQYGYNSVAIAHNRDDRVETLFINLARGTGIKGLTSIKPKIGNLIRPLLFASREDITAYAQANNIVFREDSSNASDKYTRNFIRHHIIPGLEQFFPGLQQTIERDIEHLTGVEAFYNESIERFERHVVDTKDNQICIDLQSLSKSPSPPTLLYEILKLYGFSHHVVPDILDNSCHFSGRQFFSNTHRLLCDRQTLVIQKLKKETSQEYLIDESILEISVPIILTMNQLDRDSEFKPNTLPNIACLDYHKLQFPLLLRRWRYGDSFRPLGMKNMKKLSDFFIDNKVSIIEKEQCWVLVSEEQIVWVVGLRIDDRFKITNKTKRILRIEKS